jgi:peptide/nickel transport system permease protein
MNGGDFSINLCVLAALLALLAMVRDFATNPRWERPWRRFKSDRIGRAALLVLSLYVMVGAAGLFKLKSRSLIEWAFVRVPHEQSYSAPLATRLWSADPARTAPLKGRHLLGTDALGRDVFKQTLQASSTAMLVGGFASLIYIPIGVVLGIAAGYYRRWVDEAITFFFSTLASIPNILLMISILLVFGKGTLQTACALSVSSWIGLCRLMRGEALRESQRAYVEAARSLGQSHWAIITRHILPNVAHLVFINFVLGFSGLVLSEAILSYLGVGAPIGTPSWGIMIDSARMELSREPAVWWNLLSAGGALFFLVLSLNLLGDSLRRAFDPKAK